MVRVNIINSRNLTDQHLVAEYLEIIMLVSYVKKHPSLECIPEKYCLGRGHIKFFKNKLKYLKKRHEELKKEMKKRGFKARKILKIRLTKKYMQDYKPTKKDKEVIKKRLIQKINMKPDFYRYYRKKLHKNTLIKIVKKG